MIRLALRTALTLVMLWTFPVVWLLEWVTDPDGRDIAYHGGSAWGMFLSVWGWRP